MFARTKWPLAIPTTKVNRVCSFRGRLAVKRHTVVQRISAEQMKTFPSSTQRGVQVKRKGAGVMWQNQSLLWLVCLCRSRCLEDIWQNRRHMAFAPGYISEHVRLLMVYCVVRMNGEKPDFVFHWHNVCPLDLALGFFSSWKMLICLLGTWKADWGDVEVNGSLQGIMYFLNRTISERNSNRSLRLLWGCANKCKGLYIMQPFCVKSPQDTAGPQLMNKG